MTDGKPEKGMEPTFGSPLGDMIGRWREEHLTGLKENYRLRKRIAELEGKTDEDLTAFLLSIVETIDTFDRTAGAINKALSKEDKKAKRVLNSFKSIRSQMSSSLKKFGVMPMDVAPGMEFLAGMHQASGLVQADGFSDGQIVTVEKDGYFWGDRILRTAEVVVSSDECVESEEDSRESSNE